MKPLMMVLLLLVDGRSVDSMIEACLYSIVCGVLFSTEFYSANKMCFALGEQTV